MWASVKGQCSVYVIIKSMSTKQMWQQCVWCGIRYHALVFQWETTQRWDKLSFTAPLSIMDVISCYLPCMLQFFTFAQFDNLIEGKNVQQSTTFTVSHLTCCLIELLSLWWNSQEEFFFMLFCFNSNHNGNWMTMQIGGYLGGTFWWAQKQNLMKTSHQKYEAVKQSQLQTGKDCSALSDFVIANCWQSQFSMND